MNKYSKLAYSQNDWGRPQISRDILIVDQAWVPSEHPILLYRQQHRMSPQRTGREEKDKTKGKIKIIKKKDARKKIVPIIKIIRFSR